MADTNIYIKEDFYPRPRVEGDSSAKSCGGRPSVFLPTPSRGGRPKMHIFSIALAIISFHALAWRATGGSPCQDLSIADFYPRPRVEGDVFIPNFSFPEVAISTHALTWRATVSGSRQHHPPAISTHALTWRATCRPFSWVAPIRNFYPRPHMEGDLFCKSVPYWVYISTHALTWRATFV